MLIPIFIRRMSAFEIARWPECGLNSCDGTLVLELCEDVMNRIGTALCALFTGLVLILPLASPSLSAKPPGLVCVLGVLRVVPEAELAVSKDRSSAGGAP